VQTKSDGLLGIEKAALPLFIGGIAESGADIAVSYVTKQSCKRELRVFWDAISGKAIQRVQSKRKKKRKPCRGCAVREATRGAKGEDAKM